MKIQRTIVVTLMRAWALTSHFKSFTSKFFMLRARHCQASYPLQGRSCNIGSSVIFVRMQV